MDLFVIDPDTVQGLTFVRLGCGHLCDTANLDHYIDGKVPPHVLMSVHRQTGGAAAAATVTEPQREGEQPDSSFPIAPLTCPQCKNPTAFATVRRYRREYNFMQQQIQIVKRKVQSRHEKFVRMVAEKTGYASRLRLTLVNDIVERCHPSWAPLLHQIVMRLDDAVARCSVTHSAVVEAHSRGRARNIVRCRSQCFRIQALTWLCSRAILPIMATRPCPVNPQENEAEGERGASDSNGPHVGSSSSSASRNAIGSFDFLLCPLDRPVNVTDVIRQVCLAQLAMLPGRLDATAAPDTASIARRRDIDDAVQRLRRADLADPSPEASASIEREAGHVQALYTEALPPIGSPVTRQEMLDIHKALAEGNSILDRGAWHRCPRGHLYVIGDCGNANGVGVCPECRLAIGGQGHQLLQGNAHVIVAPLADDPTWA